MAVVGHEDTNRTTESLLFMSAPPIYLLLNHTQATHPYFCIGGGVFFLASLSTLSSVIEAEVIAMDFTIWMVCI